MIHQLIHIHIYANKIMNRFIMKNAPPPSTKKSAQTNTRTTAKNGAAKNRATQLERTTLHEDILSHIKRNLPKPQADGRLKMHSKEERALQFLAGDRKRLRKKPNKLPKGNTENNIEALCEFKHDKLELKKK